LPQHIPRHILTLLRAREQLHPLGSTHIPQRPHIRIPGQIEMRVYDDKAACVEEVWRHEGRVGHEPRGRDVHVCSQDGVVGERELVGAGDGWCAGQHRGVGFEDDV
jgi:hypothetical protein